MTFRSDIAAADSDILEALGDSATITEPGQDPVQVQGVFENDYIEINGVESVYPLFSCLQSEVGSVAHGWGLSYDGSSYKVVGKEPDGMGMITLVLEKQ